jgi:hypothetical protein
MMRLVTVIYVLHAAPDEIEARYRDAEARDCAEPRAPEMG